MCVWCMYLWSLILMHVFLMHVWCIYLWCGWNFVMDERTDKAPLILMHVCMMHISMIYDPNYDGYIKRRFLVLYILDHCSDVVQFIFPLCQICKSVQKTKYILEDRRPKEKCIQKLSMYLISIHVLLTLRLFRPRAYIQIYSNTRKEEEHFDLQKIQREKNLSICFSGTSSPLLEGTLKLKGNFRIVYAKLRRTDRYKN